jgi:hypothetical protein
VAVAYMAVGGKSTYYITEFLFTHLQLLSEGGAILGVDCIEIKNTTIM